MSIFDKPWPLSPWISFEHEKTSTDEQVRVDCLYIHRGILTHWDRYKMAAILQATSHYQKEAWRSLVTHACLTRPSELTKTNPRGYNLRSDAIIWPLVTLTNKASNLYPFTMFEFRLKTKDQSNHLKIMYITYQPNTCSVSYRTSRTSFSLLEHIFHTSDTRYFP